MTIDVLNAAAVMESVSMETCIDLMATTMVAVSRAEAAMPLRSVVPMGESGSAFVVMPGALGRPPVFGAKLISYFPKNTKLPVIQGVIALFDGDSGRLKALVDAASVTAVRTAAASGMATRALAREDATTLALLGCGVQAEHHLRAMRAVRPLEQVFVWGRSLDKAKAFAERRAGGGLKVEAVPDARTAVEAADIVCTVTNSPTPVLEGSWLKPGAHLNLVGAFTPATREADTGAILRARVFVEIREFALREAGDLLIPIAEGRVTAAHVVGEIADVLTGAVPGRQSASDITAYKSLGNVAQDLATAGYAHEQAVKRGVAGLTRIAG